MKRDSRRVTVWRFLAALYIAALYILIAIGWAIGWAIADAYKEMTN